MNIDDFPNYVSPTERSYLSYFSALKQYNLSFQNRVVEDLECMMNSCDETLTVCTTGSDGRLEKGPKSQLELVLLKSGPISDDAELKFVSYFINNFSSEIYREGIEIKDLKSDSMSFYENKRDRAFPQRMMDLIYFGGNKDFVFDVKEKLFFEWQGKSGKKILERVRKKKSEFKKVVNSGKQLFKTVELTHFDALTGESFYDQDSRILSLSYNPF